MFAGCTNASGGPRVWDPWYKVIAFVFFYFQGPASNGQTAEGDENVSAALRFKFYP